MAARPATAALSCEACGRLPDPPRSRRTLASLLAMLPLELAANLLGITSSLPLAAKVVGLTVVTSVLGIWVAEPSALRLLHTWLHLPALRHRRQLEATALWRVRTVLDDGPGALDRLTHALARRGVNILSIDVHPLAEHAPGSGALDELVLAAPEGLTAASLLDALQAGGGQQSRVWATTALALADGPSRALLAAARVAGGPHSLGAAVAELLNAEPRADAGDVDPSCVLVLHAGAEPVVVVRPGEPFTPAEAARAHRLEEIAELAVARDAHPARGTVAG